MIKSDVCVWITLSILLQCSLIKQSDAQQIHNGTNQTAVWLKNLIPDHYNGKEVPFQNGNRAKVKLCVRPWTIGDISLQHMNFFINMYISMWWVDYRLNVPFNNTSVVLPEALASQLWSPNLSFRNCMDCKMIQFDSKRDKLVLKGNELIFRASLGRTCKCYHGCWLEAISRNHLTRVAPIIGGCGILTHDPLDILQLVPNFQDHSFMRNASVPQFTIKDLSSGDCPHDQDVLGNYLSCVEYKMKFVRQISYQLMLTYCPSMIIVLASWISFWLDVDLVAPRVTLGLTSLLTLSTQFSNAQKDLPPVSYLTAVDIWFIFCMFMVFASLTEFAVSYTLRKFEKKKNVWTKSGSIVQPIEPVQGLSSKKPAQTIPLDQWSKIAFPVTYFLFNICYWSYYNSR